MCKTFCSSLILYVVDLQNISIVINICVFRLLGTKTKIYTNIPCGFSCCEERWNGKESKKLPFDDFSWEVLFNCSTSSSWSHWHIGVQYADFAACAADSRDAPFCLLVVAWFALIPELSVSVQQHLSLCVAKFWSTVKHKNSQHNDSVDPLGNARQSPYHNLVVLVPSAEISVWLLNPLGEGQEPLPSALCFYLFILHYSSLISFLFYSISIKSRSTTLYFLSFLQWYLNWKAFFSLPFYGKVVPLFSCM